MDVLLKECSICEKKYLEDGGDLMHKSKHSKKKLYQVFDILVGTKNEVKITTLCDTCTNSLNDHDKFYMKNLIPNREKYRKPRVCPHCGQEFVQFLGGFTMHVKWCEIKSKPGPYRCPIKDCTLEFDEYESMRRHKNYHTQIIRGNIGKDSEKVRTPCEICGKMIPRNTGMRNHLASHGINDTYYCPLCTKTYNTLPALRCHFISKHPEFYDDQASRVAGYNMKYYICILCPSEKFNKLTKFSQHIKEIHPQVYQNYPNCQ